MKFIVAVGFVALVVIVSADVSHLSGVNNEYLPPHQHQHQHQTGHHTHHESHAHGRSFESSNVNQEYLPPVEDNEAAPAHRLEADGYHYKAPQASRFRF